MRIHVIAILTIWTGYAGISECGAQDGEASSKASAASPAVVLEYRPSGNTPLNNVWNEPAEPWQEPAVAPTGIKPVQLKSDRFGYSNLMFEDYELERFGSCCPLHERRKVVLSGFRFFGKGILFPLDILRRKHLRCYRD